MSSTPRYDDELWADRVLVYGDNEGLVFIPRAKALELAEIWKAIDGSKTWGDLRHRMPPGAWKDLYATLGDDECRTLSWFRESERKENPDLTEEEILARYRELEFQERQPFDDDIFDSSTLSDHSWPAFPHHEMLNWMPQSVQKRYGRIAEAKFTADWLALEPSDADAIARDLGAFGYTCIRDETLVGQCYGYGF